MDLKPHRLNLFSLGLSRMDYANDSQRMKRLDVEILILVAFEGFGLAGNTSSTPR